MRVALTGATGFVGLRLAAALCRDGQAVQALVQPGADTRVLDGYGVRIVPGDIRDEDAVSRALEGAELAYHVAGLVPGAGRTRAEYRSVNVGGAENVVRAVRRNRVRHLVHCSTVAVYGALNHIPADEKAAVAPVNAYQASKLEAERVIRRGANEAGFSAVIARLTPLYGPGDRLMLRLFRDISRGRLTILGSGATRCHLTHVDDVVAGLCLCAAPAPSGAACFILGSEEYTTISELVRMIAEAVHVTPKIRHLPAAPFAAGAALYHVVARHYAPVPGMVNRLDFFLTDHAYDVSKARRELGFHADIPLRDGLAGVAAWYRDAHLL